MQTFQEFASDVVPKLYAMGPHLACDTVLIGKLVRLAKTFVSQVSTHFSISKPINNCPNNEVNCQNSILFQREVLPGNDESKEDVFRSLLTMVDEVLLPCQCLLSNNCCMLEEIWSFLKMLNYQYRLITRYFQILPDTWDQIILT